MWTIRTVSGIYDIHRIVTVFYSVFQMEQTLLCADQLLSHPVRIERGEDVRILPEHLQKVENGRSGYHYGGYKRCTNCGYETTEDFVFCPKCGMRL